MIFYLFLNSNVGVALIARHGRVRMPAWSGGDILFASQLGDKLGQDDTKGTDYVLHQI